MISNAITGVSVMGAKEGTILQQGVVRSDPEVSEEPVVAARLLCTQLIHLF